MENRGAIRGIRRRALRFTRRYAYGIMAMMVLASVMLWQTWERPRHVRGPSSICLKPIPLSTVLVTLHPEKKTLRAVVEDLGRQCGVAVDYQDKSLKGLGVDDSTPLKMEEVPSKPVPLQAALVLVCRTLVGLDFDIEPDRIVFGGGTLNSESRAIRVVYPIADLLRVQSPSERAVPSRDKAAELVTLITGNIDPYKWRVNGGSTASVSLDYGCLIIDASPSAHYMIAQLLEKLRESP